MALSEAIGASQEEVTLLYPDKDKSEAGSPGALLLIAQVEASD